MSSTVPKVDIRALAALARVKISDEEVAALGDEIPSILAFVESIQGVDVSGVSSDTSLRNVVRADENPHEPGAYTEDLLALAPYRVGDRIAVKQVVSRKNH
ncbi:MAG TPA: Asp-tRNA(Asn)/Glu-tRNA(Gln) amidotransferase subunit GatC [Candidatus Paceibacterota bacterium]|nr:Asp-tRNA(Asn)/Glu-tRNA(Gln) amidotransferase subunit GatC [Candidatus Paceibacterota bacterium]